MPGPGKYNASCTQLVAELAADGVVLIVVNGKRGSGFAVQATPLVHALLPSLLRSIADDIDIEWSRQQS